MKVIFEGCLSEPPSSVNCFRDATLYTSCFVKADVLLECEKNLKDSYYHWLKSYGAYDFIDEIVEVNEETGYKIGIKKASLKIDRITAHNLHIIVRSLDKFKRLDI